MAPAHLRMVAARALVPLRRPFSIHELGSLPDTGSGTSIWYRSLGALTLRQGGRACVACGSAMLAPCLASGHEAPHVAKTRVGQRYTPFCDSKYASSSDSIAAMSATAAS